MKALITLAMAALLAWHSNAHALACGDTLTSDTTLTADLHCTTGWVALYVPTSGITLRLNGHTLSGDVALQGVSILSASNVRILGPGRITGFWAGVNATRADYLAVQDVDFDHIGAGVIASDTLGSSLQRNDFRNVNGWGIYVFAHPGASRPLLGGHTISYNLVLESVGGVVVCGHANSANLIKGNTLQGLSDYGIHLLDGSGRNEVRDNQLLKMESAGLVLRGSRGNTVKGNKFDYGHTGIAMIPEFTGACPSGYSSPAVRDNLIDGNSIFKQDVGIAAGLGGKSLLVLKNRLRYNKLYDDATGIYFNTDTYANDATLNAYSGTAIPVDDHGVGNTW